MKTLFSQRYSLVIMTSLLGLPLFSSAALSEGEIRHIVNHEDENYLYCDQEMAAVIEEISRLDKDHNSPAWQLYRHIQRGNNIGEESAVKEALEYAAHVVNNNPQAIQTRKQLISVIQAVEAGNFNVDIDVYTEDQLRDAAHNENDASRETQIIKLRQKLYAMERAKFFEDVEFKDEVNFEDAAIFQNNVTIQGTLSAADQIISGSLSVTDANISCDLTVGCNISLNDSLTPAIGNIVKNGTNYLSNFGTNNTFLGKNAGNFTVTGIQNVAFGDNALSSITTPNGAVAVGYNAMHNNTTGIGNTALGSNALSTNISGLQNTAFGFNTLILSTGNNNTGLGSGTLQSLTTGSNNIAIGNGSGAILTTGSNNIYLAASAGSISEANTMRLGVPGTQTRCFIAGISGVTTGLAAVAALVDANGQLGTISSTRRVKHNIQDMGNDSAAIYRLRPVTFAYNGDESETKQYGLIAEEVSEVMPEIVVTDENGQPFTVQYHVLPALLVNEVQRLRASLVASHQALAQRIAQLEARA